MIEIDGQPMEVVEAPVITPQPAVSPPAAALAKKTLAPTPKPRATRRKTLCDISNLSKRDPADGLDKSAACPASPAPAGAGGDEGFVAQLVKKNKELMRLLAVRDEIIELSGAEIQKLRLANWELARSNSQMTVELNLARNSFKELQHELACSRATLKAKASELEDVKKTMQRCKAPVQRTRLLCPDGDEIDAENVKKAMQRRNTPVQRTRLLCPDGDVIDKEPSDASRARSGNAATMKRVLISRSLGPTASAKLALPKDRDASQTRKSMTTPQPSSNRREDLFEIEDVQLAIGSCKTDPQSASGNDKPGQQFLRRSSLGRPLRQAKEMPLHVKLRRP